MEDHIVECQTLASSNTLSPSSSSSSSSSYSLSSCSSSCSSSSFNASIFPLIVSPVDTERDVINNPSMPEPSNDQWLRFFGIIGNGNCGTEWRDIEKRFDRLALTSNGSEQALKWSDFGFCIGEKTLINF